MGSPSRVALVVLTAAIVAQIARLGALAPLVLAGLLFVASLLALQWRQRRSTQHVLAPSWFAGPLATCWLVVTLLPVHKFSHRGFNESGPSLSVESFLEVLVFAGVGLVALLVLRTLEPTLADARPPIVLFLYPVWTATTGLWSDSGAFAIVRGNQMVVTALLAWATVALARADPEAFRGLVARTLRWFARATLVLVVLGVAFGPVYVLTSEKNLERFTWVGAHPLAAGLIMSVALVIVLATPSPVLRMSPLVRIASAVVLVGALVPNHSRQTWLGLAVVFLVAQAAAGRLTPLFRSVGGPLVAAAAVAGLMYRGQQLWDYVLRNEDSQALGTGNGRLGLWSIGYRALDTPFDWMAGLGHGIARTVFVAEAPWARTAHSSFLAVLVSAGLVGMCAFVAALLVTSRNIVVVRLWHRETTGLTLTLVFVLVLLNGLVSDNLAEPNLGFAMLYFVAAFAIVVRSRALAGADGVDERAAGADAGLGATSRTFTP